jgi:hypothetical protein
LEWVVNATSIPLYQWVKNPVFTVKEARLASGPVWKGAATKDDYEK